MTAKHTGVAKMWLLNLAGNAALPAAVYVWLLLPDAHGWQVAGSAVLALLILFCGFWLRTGSFAYFRRAEFRENGKVWRAFRHALRQILALLLWAIPFGAVILFLIWLRRFTPQFGVWLWQKAPALRLGTPRQMFQAADCLLWVLMGLVAAFWLPIATTVAAAGLRPKHMARSLRVLRHPVYWLWLCIFALFGLYVPYKLVWWIPELSDLPKQAWSMGIRFTSAYVVLITAWIALLLVVGSRAESEDPESTA